MASNDSQKPEFNEKRAHRENQQFHFESISKSIEAMVHRTNNTKFKSDVFNMLNIKTGHRKKSVQSQIMKLLKTNYQEKNPPKERNPKLQTTNSSSTSGRTKRKDDGKNTQ